MIRRATVDDIRAIVEIYNEAVEQRFATGDLEAVTVQQRTAWFHDHDETSFPIYVAVRGDAVVGWCSLSAYRPGRAAFLATAEISYYVRTDSRRSGVGTALVVHAIEDARRIGKRVLFGILLEKNQPSITLLQNCGFELWARLPDVASIDGELVSHVYYGRRI
jgi:L-amino acid N-acyltransferase YncA